MVKHCEVVSKVSTGPSCLILSDRMIVSFSHIPVRNLAPLDTFGSTEPQVKQDHPKHIQNKQQHVVKIGDATEMTLFKHTRALHSKSFTIQLE